MIDRNRAIRGRESRGSGLKARMPLGFRGVDPPNSRGGSKVPLRIPTNPSEHLLSGANLRLLPHDRVSDNR